MTFRSCLVALGLSAAALAAHGQALPTATHGGVFGVGVGFSYGRTDIFTTNGVTGVTAFATFDLNEHLGAQADVHLMILSTPNDFVEDTYLIGPRYTQRFHRFSLYVKVEGGIGTTSTDQPSGAAPPFVVNTPGTYFALGMGGGVDVPVYRHVSVHGDLERQLWPGFPPNSLTPTIFTGGLVYHFRLR